MSLSANRRPLRRDMRSTPAGDAKDSAAGVARRVRQQKDDRLGDFLRLADAPKRYRGQDPFDPAGRMDVGRDDAGRDRVDADAIAGKLARKPERHALDR